MLTCHHTSGPVAPPRPDRWSHWRVPFGDDQSLPVTRGSHPVDGHVFYACASNAGGRGRGAAERGRERAGTLVPGILTGLDSTSFSQGDLPLESHDCTLGPLIIRRFRSEPCVTIYDGPTHCPHAAEANGVRGSGEVGGDAAGSTRRMISANQDPSAVK